MASQNVVQSIDLHPPLAGAGGGRGESNMLDVLFSIILSLLVLFLSRIVIKPMLGTRFECAGGTLAPK